ncbi:peptidase inhibitor family I36 protein [Streptomyces capitiformicae]|uniref:Secreted protein n=1 Tax=Streptomyces capitiformicae TaxID=2014920 RepID=A0A919GPJ7_9ACTN|nr:peptidase inhibitor family I36 protein [Streptomyces capitiformicae]GHH88004.1 hypothetical protein GCM10017771_31550 [Streptomyces capitiformicae]
MRKLITTAALLGLATLGLTVPATAEQAAESAVAGPVCDSKWGPRNGKVYAWDLPDCSGTLLPVPISGTWGPDANDRASSVMNRGYAGSLDHVAFYENGNYSGGQVCLAPGEMYADNLAYSRFSNGAPVDNNISAHRWVDRGSCAFFLT